MPNPVQPLPPPEENPPVNEALWQEWLARGKRNERATKRHMSWFGGFAVAVLAAVFYFFAVR